MDLDEIFKDNQEPIAEPVQWWQLDKIESIIHLCPYDEYKKQYIIDNPPETKEEADKLLGQLWFDHIPRDPKDQLDKWIKLKTI